MSNGEWGEIMNDCHYVEVVCTPSIENINIHRFESVPQYTIECSTNVDSFTISDTLPQGFTFNSNTGIISSDCLNLINSV